MKLINSKTEDTIRRELIKSRELLFNIDNKPIITFLKKSFSHMKTAYILEYIPEQCEDIYILLIDTANAVKIEVDRYQRNKIFIHEVISLAKYTKLSSRQQKIKITIAIDLVQQNKYNI